MNVKKSIGTAVESRELTDAERLLHGFHECLEVMFYVVHYYVDLVHVTTDHNLLYSHRHTQFSSVSNIRFEVQLTHDEYYANKYKIRSQGADTCYVTYFKNFTPPSISMERLKLQTSDLLCSLHSFNWRWRGQFHYLHATFYSWLTCENLNKNYAVLIICSICDIHSTWTNIPIHARI